MAKISHDDMILKHGEEGAAFVQILSQIQRTSMDVRRATIAKALLNSFYKGTLAEEWLVKPKEALELIENCADVYPKNYKMSLRRLDTGKMLGPGNWILQGVKPNAS